MTPTWYKPIRTDMKANQSFNAGLSATLSIPFNRKLVKQCHQAAAARESDRPSGMPWSCNGHWQTGRRASHRHLPSFSRCFPLALLQMCSGQTQRMMSRPPLVRPGSCHPCAHSSSPPSPEFHVLVPLHIWLPSPGCTLLSVVLPVQTRAQYHASTGWRRSSWQSVPVPYLAHWRAGAVAWQSQCPAGKR